MITENAIRDLIAQWPTRRELAAEIGANVEVVHKWATSGRIPAHWQSRVVRAAQAKGLAHVTHEWIADVHASLKGVA
jgi:hypothetical protein